MDEYNIHIFIFGKYHISIFVEVEVIFDILTLFLKKKLKLEKLKK